MELIFAFGAAAALVLAGLSFLPQPQPRAVRVRAENKRRL
ncbi:hypothetical protein EDD53_0673 [Pacificibacter maritimus]|uniref:Uncharacterized protein n=1 Tax=Pacificibacter maritimus TaxID=762213 RepID=A0A3N4ULV7_9RHOB|nr:hypothetical protein EDD53_0673 [Pacificibacter maritimus]